MSVVSRMVAYQTRLSSCLSRMNVRQEFVRRFRTKSKEKPDTVMVEPPVEVPDVVTDRSRLSKYLLYTAVVVPCSFTGCMIWQYENIRAFHRQSKGQSRDNGQSRDTSDLDNQFKQFGFRDHMNGLWNSIHPNMRFVWGVVAANASVFLLWKVRAFGPFMIRYFMCNPTKGHSVTASTLSAFSHYSGIHLFVNMYVMVGFSGVLLSLLGKEQFFAVYLGGATLSSLASTVFKLRSGRLVPSLGASGALLSLIAYACYSLPDARLSIVLVDKIFPHSFSGTTALVGIILLDCVGILRGWKMFDHAAHLGGTLFGLFYAAYAKKYVWEKYRHPVLKQWHKVRSPKKPKDV